MPVNATRLQVTAAGAYGGLSYYGGPAAHGGQVRATVPVVPKEVLTVVVGGTGENQPPLRRRLRWATTAAPTVSAPPPGASWAMPGSTNVSYTAPTLYNELYISTSIAESHLVITTVPATNNALAFEGIDDYVSVPSTTGLSLRTVFTPEAWLKPGSGGAAVQTVLGKAGGAASGHLFAHTTDAWATLVTRTTGTALAGAGTNQSILRSFNIQPTVNSGLNSATQLPV